jgi:uncharacterized membrane protein
MKKIDWFMIGMMVGLFAIGAAFYPYLPAQIASHWNAAGEVNGYMGKFWGVFLVPILFIIIAAVFFVIPRVDPKRDNIAKFRKYYEYLVFAISFFFLYIYLLMLLWNVGYRFDFALAIIPAIAGLFYVIGAILPNTEPNWTIGLRTPWTISNDAVWRKTNRAGGLAFKTSAVIGLIGMFFSAKIGFWFLLVPIIASMIGLVIYSYVLYERGTK